MLSKGIVGKDVSGGNCCTIYSHFDVEIWGKGVMLKIENASKKYGSKIVFSNLNYEFKNQVYWLQGKNGIGKSVFTRCLVGFEKFSEGKVIGELGNILYLPDTSLGEKWLTINENIELLLFYYGIHVNDDEKERIRRTLDLGDGNDLVSHISVGTSMKLGVFLLFIGNYWKTIVLDETFSHLDIQTKQNILLELEKRSQEGAVIIIIHHGELLNLDVYGEEIVHKIQITETGLIDC